MTSSSILGTTRLASELKPARYQLFHQLCQLFQLRQLFQLGHPHGRYQPKLFHQFPQARRLPSAGTAGPASDPATADTASLIAASRSETGC
jgi:hypothetical protein